MIIYKITNKLNGMVYIGQTTRTLRQRWIDHYCKKSCSYLYAAIQKYGKENFSLDIIAEYATLEDLNNAEEYYVDWYNCLAPNGYNLKTGGGSYGKHTEITLKKLKGRGPNKGFLGHNHTTQTKRKISLGLKKYNQITKEIK